MSAHHVQGLCRSWRTILAVTFLCSVGGCGGGGGGGGSQQNPVVFAETLSLGPAGGTIEDATRGIKLTIPVDALTRSTDVTLEVRQSQRPSVTPAGWSSNANAIDVAVDPTALDATGNIEIRIVHEPLTAEEAPLMLTTDDTSKMLPIESEQGAGGFVGLLTKSHFEEGGRARSRAGGTWLGIVLLIAERVASHAAGSLWVFDNGQFRQPVLGETMDSECTAVLVHGIFDSKNALVPVAQWLLETTVPPHDPEAAPSYEQVWAYSYNWLAGIDGSGEDLAQDLAAVKGSGKIDIWAHSMGGLVARWAIEKEGVGDYVHRLYTVGTPHEGIPFQTAVVLLAFLLDVPLTDGIEDMLDGSSFLTSLNSGTSPYRATASYFTLCGNVWNTSLLYYPLGWLYSQFGLENDGAVPVDSAQSSVLQNKSEYWSNNATATATVALNHSDLRSVGTSVLAPVSSVFTDAARGWLEPCARIQFEDDFESSTVGGSPIHWQSFSQEPPETNVLVAWSDAGQGRSCAFVDTSPVNGAWISRALAQPDAQRISIEWSQRLESLDDHLGMFIDDTTLGVAMAGNDPDHPQYRGQVIVNTRDVSTGGHTSIAVLAWEPGRWYRFRTEINRVGQTFDLWVDGNRVISGVPFRVPTSVLFGYSFVTGGQSYSPTATRRWVDDFREFS